MPSSRVRGVTVPADKAVQTLRQEVGKHSAVRSKGARKIGLIGRQFQHHDLTIMGRLDIQHTTANVTRQLRRTTVFLNDMVDQGARCGFAV